MNSIKILLRNSLVQENLCNFMLIACDGPLPKEFLPGPVVDKWVECGNGCCHLNHHKKKISGQIVTSQIIYYRMNCCILNKTTNT